MKPLLPNDQRTQLEALYEDMAPHGLTPLWEVLSALVMPLFAAMTPYSRSKTSTSGVT